MSFGGRLWKVFNHLMKKSAVNIFYIRYDDDYYFWKRLEILLHDHSTTTYGGTTTLEGTTLMSLDTYSSYINAGTWDVYVAGSYSFVLLLPVFYGKIVLNTFVMWQQSFISKRKSPTKFWLLFGRWKPQNGGNSPGEEHKVSEDPQEKTLGGKNV